jgi:hypothetical protein
MVIDGESEMEMIIAKAFRTFIRAYRLSKVDAEVPPLN